jgi:hypothetical protein
VACCCVLQFVRAASLVSDPWYWLAYNNEYTTVLQLGFQSCFDTSASLHATASADHCTCPLSPAVLRIGCRLGEPGAVPSAVAAAMPQGLVSTAASTLVPQHMSVSFHRFSVPGCAALCCALAAGWVSRVLCRQQWPQPCWACGLVAGGACWCPPGTGQWSRYCSLR